MRRRRPTILERTSARENRQEETDGRPASEQIPVRQKARCHEIAAGFQLVRVLSLSLRVGSAMLVHSLRELAVPNVGLFTAYRS